MKNICLFLGAGASSIYEKPTTFEFRTELKFPNTNDVYFYNNTSITKLFSSYKPRGDIEDFLESLKNIFDFDKSLGRELFSLCFPSFFGEKHEKINAIEVIPEETSYVTLPTKNHTVNHPIYDNTIEKLIDIQQHIYKQIFNKYSWKNKHNDLLQSTLSPIFSLLSEHQIFVATTNYDQVFETFCDIAPLHLKYVDGFERNRTDRMVWSGKFRNETHDPKNIFYYKLHGSLDWKEMEGYGIVRTKIENFGNIDGKNIDCLIYPTISPKDGVIRDPFKTIYEKFKESLLNADIVIVVGFSFRDEEITKLFNKFYHSGKQMLILDPSPSIPFLKQTVNEFYKDFVTMEHGTSLTVDKMTVMKCPFSQHTVQILMDVLREEFLDESPLLDALEKNNLK